MEDRAPGPSYFAAFLSIFAIIAHSDAAPFDAVGYAPPLVPLIVLIASQAAIVAWLPKRTCSP